MLIFGLDIGTTSIGFAAIDLDEANRSGRILRLGARIFPEARDADGTPLNQQRRAKRMLRRQLRRRRERRRSLNELLAAHGLLPAFGGKKWDALMKIDPYALRARAPRRAARAARTRPRALSSCQAPAFQGTRPRGKRQRARREAFAGRSRRRPRARELRRRVEGDRRDARAGFWRGAIRSPSANAANTRPAPSSRTNSGALSLRRRRIIPPCAIGPSSARIEEAIFNATTGVLAQIDARALPAYSRRAAVPKGLVAVPAARDAGEGQQSRDRGRQRATSVPRRARRHPHRPLDAEVDELGRRPRCAETYLQGARREREDGALQPRIRR